MTVPLAATAVEVDVVTEKSASYFCQGNKNFLACIKPEIDFESRQCIDYVVENSKPCVGSELSQLSSNSSSSEIEKAATLYTQCSMLELLKAENIEYAQFQDCFDSKYDESQVHPKLNKRKQ
ncbi:hypothetical protein [Microbulbifer sp. GL-2]|uniref:hypothetical protein n=1 Tax=Microbulbifer sp. GL-2 TaxID=2591606 RepID=UPI00117D296E|nr:hypothetical protein [Microbulbifer sp. GL-2]